MSSNSIAAHFSPLAMALILLVALGSPQVDARRSHGSKSFQGSQHGHIKFSPITTPATDETCAVDYGGRDTNGLVEIAGGRFSQEFLESVGAGNQFTVCFGRAQRRDAENIAFTTQTFQVETVLHASRIMEDE